MTTQVQMSRVAKDSYVLLGTLSIAKGKRIGAVAQLMESIDQSDSSFASIKSFSSLQKMQKKMATQIRASQPHAFELFLMRLCFRRS